MDELLKKLDGIMMSNLVRKVGALLCLTLFVLAFVGFIAGASALIKQSATVGTEVEEAVGGEEANEEAEESAAEDAEEEAVEEEIEDAEEADAGEEVEEVEEEAHDEAEEGHSH